MRAPKTTLLSLLVLFGLSVPATSFAQDTPDSATEATETAESAEGSGSEKNWKIEGNIGTRIGQGTFTDLENDAGVPGERKPNSTAYDRASMVYTLSPSYKYREFQFGAEFQLVHWLTPGGGMFGIPAIGGANDASDVFFQDIALSAAWKGYTFDSIGLTLAPSLSVNLPTHKYSQMNNKYFDASLNLSATKQFFDRLTLQASFTGVKYFHRYKTPAVDVSEVGQNNVLYRPGGAEDIGHGLIAVGGYNTSGVFSSGAAADIRIVEDLSGSISYSLINFYSYPGPDRDQFSAENSQPKTNLSQVASTGVTLSYKINKYLSVSSGIGSYMSPKTADNKSFRFPFWNTEGAAANTSWIEAGVSGQY